MGTLTTLTNVQNSLFIPKIPYLGSFLNRRPTYTLTQPQRDLEEGEPISDVPEEDEKLEPPPRLHAQRTYTGASLNSISSNVNDKYYAVLPHGVSLPGWSEEEKLELNDHVRHMLHSKRSKFKRAMKGFGQYVRKREYSALHAERLLISQLSDSSSPSTQHSSRSSASRGFFS